MPEYEVRFVVSATQAARKQGLKIGVSKKCLLELIGDISNLKYWPENSEEFEYEKAFGALEFKYTKENKWIRVIVYQDDFRKTMWVIRVFAKKTNKISAADRIGIQTAVKKLEAELRLLEKRSKIQTITLVEGGKK